MKKNLRLLRLLFSGSLLMGVLGTTMLVTGCGGGRFATAPVSGQVTVDGEPVANVLVTFTPIGSAAELGPGSTGRTDASGRYTLELVGGDRAGAQPGRHRVTLAIRDEASFAMDEEAYAEAMAQPQVVLPEEARTGIEVEVVAGQDNVHDFTF